MQTWRYCIKRTVLNTCASIDTLANVIIPIEMVFAFPSSFWFWKKKETIGNKLLLHDYHGTFSKAFTLGSPHFLEMFWLILMLISVGALLAGLAEVSYNMALWHKSSNSTSKEKKKYHLNSDQGPNSAYNRVPETPVPAQHREQQGPRDSTAVRLPPTAAKSKKMAPTCPASGLQGVLQRVSLMGLLHINN